MWTLTEAAKMTNDVLLKGIIATIIKESPIMDKLPFRPIRGNGWTYNRETTLPTVGFYSVGDTWVESSGTRTQYTASLKILGGDIDIDEFERQTMSDQQSLEATNIEEKSKGMAHGFEDAFVYENVSTNAKAFDGLHALVASAQKKHAGSGSTGAAGSMAKLDQMINLVKPKRPDLLMTTREIQTRITQYYRDGTAGAAFQMIPGKDGIPLAFYGGIPILVNDFQTMTETISGDDYSAKTGGATGTIFAMKFGPKLLCGGENGGIQKKRIGDLETKDAVRWRIKWYVTVALLSTLALARYDGITDAAFTD